MGDPSRSFTGSRDFQEPNDEIADLRTEQVPKKDDPETNPDKKPLAGPGRRTQAA